MSDSTIKHPEIFVRLTGEDGNAFFILGKVRQALQSHGVSQEEINQYLEEATRGDYNYLLQVTLRWVSVG